MEETILRDLGAILVGASVVVLLGRAIGAPSIIAYLVAGLALGPGLGIVPGSPAVDLISESGIVLLLFLVGLELSVAKLATLGSVPVVVGAVQVPLAAVAIAGISLGFGLPAPEAVFLGVALTFSSTVVTVSLLDRMGSLDALHGRISVGVLLVQDLMILVVLTVVSGLGGAETSDAGPAALLRALGGMVVLSLFVALAARRVLPPLFSRAASSQEILLLGSLAWCFILVLGAETIGLSPEIGAFMAGVSLAQLPYGGDLRRRVHPLMSFFIAVFFVSLGIHMEIGSALARWPLVVTLAAFSLVVKPVVVAHLSRWRGVAPRTAMLTGLDLGHTSEFSVVLGSLALERGLVSGEVLSIVAAVGLLTMGLSALPISHGPAIVGWLERRRILPWLTGRTRGGSTLVEAPARGAPHGHVIVVGMNTLGRRIVQILAAEGERTLAIDTDPAKLRDLPCRTLLGNVEYVTVLRSAGLENAKLLVSALRIEDVNRLLAYRAAIHGVPAVIHSYDRSGEAELLSLGVAHLMDSRTAGVDQVTRDLRAEGLFQP